MGLSGYPAWFDAGHVFFVITPSSLPCDAAAADFYKHNPQRFLIMIDRMMGLRFVGVEALVRWCAAQVTPVGRRVLAHWHSISGGTCCVWRLLTSWLIVHRSPP